MITLGSGTHSITLYSKDLQSFQKDCLLLLQKSGLSKVSYTSPDNTIKIVSEETENITDSINWLWQVLVKQFSYLTSETTKKTIFFEEKKDGLKTIINCSHDLKTKLKGKPCGYNLNELFEEDEKRSGIWKIKTLDGQFVEDFLCLKEKELLASFNHEKFWMYQFSINRSSIAEMTHKKPPISSIG